MSIQGASTEGVFLSPARLLERYGLYAKKSWGQCFLHDRNAVQRIVDLVAIEPGELVVEIGAGLGALTSLLAVQAGRVLAIERDRDLVAVLRNEFAERAQVEIVEANALTFDFSQFSPPAKVVGNLPYHISSPLIFHLLGQRIGIASLTIMLQKELADRLAAPAGSRLYGAPSVTVGNVAEVVFGFRVGRGAFVPAPQVDSAVISLRLRPAPLFEDVAFFERVVRTAFGARRKQLKSALARSFAPDSILAALDQAAIRPDLRAETIDLEGFVRLARALAERCAEQ